jgi:hypothetical protein
VNFGPGKWLKRFEFPSVNSERGIRFAVSANENAQILTGSQDVNEGVKPHQEMEKDGTIYLFRLAREIGVRKRKGCLPIPFDVQTGE